MSDDRYTHFGLVISSIWNFNYTSEFFEAEITREKKCIIYILIIQTWKNSRGGSAGICYRRYEAHFQISPVCDVALVMHESWIR